MSQDRTDATASSRPDDSRMLEQLTEATDDSMWMFSHDVEELVFVNSAYEDIFGQSVERLKAEPTAFLEAVHPDDKAEVQAALERMASGEEVELEFRVNPEEDYETWVWVQGEPVYDESGDVEYLAGYTRDVTRRKEYERRLEQRKTDPNGPTRACGSSRTSPPTTCKSPFGWCPVTSTCWRRSTATS
ncbi:MAG: PAS domain-containing protein [Halobacteriaceae archaeon]